VPVLDEDDATARTVARELRECVGIDARPVLLSSMASGLNGFSAASFVVTTPYHAARVAALAPRKPLIVATLSLELLHGLLERAAGSNTVVAVPSDWVGHRVEAALRQRRALHASVVVVSPELDLVQLRREADCIFVWPGAEAVLEVLPADECVRPVRLLSEATLDRVRTAVLEASMRLAVSVSTSSAS
jgi:hypothetical protein